MKKKFLLLILCPFVFTSHCWGQSWDMAPQPPDQTMFSRHGNYPVSYYTGTPQISIPLYTIKEKDVEIPLTLNYSGTGVRVADESTWVGLGWNLYPGGSISRIVVGSQFDTHLSDVYNALLGQWSTGTEVEYVRRHHYQSTGYVFRGSDIEGVVATTVDPNTETYTILPGMTVAGMEGWAMQASFFQPDIYAFNFLGFSGKFFFHPETNEPVIMSKNENILFEKDDASWDPAQDGWKATLSNGIVVFFQALERVQQIAGCSNAAPSLTWKITKIVLLNGEELNFTYTDWSYETATISDLDVYSYEDDQDYELNRYQTDYFNYFNLPFPTVDCDYDGLPAPVLNELKVLQQISTPSYIVNFTTKANEVRPMLEALNINERNAPQTEVAYKFEYAEFVKADLAWNQRNVYLTTPAFYEPGESFVKFKLTSLQKVAIKNGIVVETENPHLFYYHEEIGLPSALSFAQDYWGYYNGEDENRGLIPDETQMYANEGYWPVVYLPDRRPLDDLRARANSNRGTSFDHLKQGTLNRIVHPTKGYTRFVFGPHEFYLSDLDDYLLQADEITYDAGSGYYSDNYSGSHTAPSTGAGLRIEEIINFDSEGSFSGRTKFEYSGAGLLLEPVHFWGKERYLQTNVNGSEVYYYKTWNASGSNYNQSFQIPNSVGYTHVVVKESDSEFDGPAEKINGRVQYSFHNVETVYDPRFHSVSFAYVDTRNGQPLSVTHFDGANAQVKKVDYHHEAIESGMFLSMAAKHVLQNSEEKYNVFKIEYTPLKFECWKEDYVTEWQEGVQTITFSDYSADGYAHLTSQRIENTSDGQTRETRYRYPLDYDVSATTESGSDPEYTGLRELIERNIVSAPVEVIQLKNDKVVSATLTTYRVREGVPRPYQVFSLEGVNGLPVNETPGQNVNPYFDWSHTVLPGGSGGGGLFSKDGAYNSIARTAFNSYDEKGNIREYALSNGQMGAYQWGYSKTKPVAQVVNAQNNQYQAQSTVQSTKVLNISFGGAAGPSTSIPITVDYLGTVILNLGVLDNPSYTTVAEVTGITSTTQTLAKNGCGLTTFQYDNVPPGTYTLTISLTTPDGGSAVLGACGEVEYPYLPMETHGTVEFFFENFEENCQAGVVENSLIARTGTKYFSGDYTASFTRPNSRTYIIEYWYLDTANKWQYIKKPYAASSMLLSEGSAIDDVRIYPSDALMTNYTYDPLFGVTSKTDPNGMTTFYTYDPFGRLHMVKDFNGNVLKTYSYHFRND